ncbi:MAG: hypothetical protein J5892_04440 [Bacilli bacterium]|nr:hypothetical protein [Bacilli bacterium]
MDNNNNFYNFGSSANDDMDKAKALAESLNNVEYKRRHGSKKKSIIFGLIATLTGFYWVFILLFLLIMFQIDYLRTGDPSGASGLYLLYYGLWFSFCIPVSIVCALIAVSNDVNVISSIGLYSSLHLAILHLALWFCRYNMFRFVLIIIMLLLLIFLFLRWLKKRQN